MKTDSLFYRLFQTAPSIFFELLDQPIQVAQHYTFRSVELKQVAFRIDGVFLPQPEAPDPIVWFVEVQFQNDPEFYHRFFAEIFLFLQQSPQTVDWRAVVLFAKRNVEPSQSHLFRSLLDCPQVQRLYLEELQTLTSDSLGVALVQLIVAQPQTAVIKAQRLVEQVQSQGNATPEIREIIEMIETIMVYKFPQLSREEIERMFSLGELRQTRVYQEAWQEGRQEGETALILRLLHQRFGKISPGIETRIRGLSLSQLEVLSDVLLNFASLEDLAGWLDCNA